MIEEPTGLHKTVKEIAEARDSSTKEANVFRKKQTPDLNNAQRDFNAIVIDRNEQRAEHYQECLTKIAKGATGARERIKALKPEVGDAVPAEVKRAYIAGHENAIARVETEIPTEEQIQEAPEVKIKESKNSIDDLKGIDTQKDIV